MIDREVCLAVGYVGFLLAVAFALERSARRTDAVGRSVAGEPTWPHWEAARFQRGIALALVVLAGAVLGVTAMGRPPWTGCVLLAFALGFTVAVGYRTLARFQAAPSSRP